MLELRKVRIIEILIAEFFVWRFARNLKIPFKLAKVRMKQRLLYLQLENLQ